MAMQSRVTPPSVGAMPGYAATICLAKTMKAMHEMPTLIPRIASRWMARDQNMPRKKPPRRPPA